ncbi:MAG: hypothetical protein EOP04_04130 [Proteobacteria bacterium]|nr:MAG: hypothetical protein EOP04_04130 [Pseudomonadota bacterium]
MPILVFAITLWAFSVVPIANSSESPTNLIGNMRLAREELRKSGGIENCASLANERKYEQYLAGVKSYRERNEFQSCKVANDCIYSPYYDFVSRKDKSRHVANCELHMGQDIFASCYMQRGYFFPDVAKAQPKSVSCVNNRCQAIYVGPQRDLQKDWSEFGKLNPLSNDYVPADKICQKYFPFFYSGKN